MVYVGLDLSRTRLDVHVMDEAGAPLAVTTARCATGAKPLPSHLIPPQIMKLVIARQKLGRELAP